MTKAKKIIKYFAFSLAIMLIICIFYSIIGLISSIFGFSMNKDNNEYIKTQINNNIDNLEIEIDSSKLVIVDSDIFKIDTNNENIKIKETNNKLIIKEKNTLFNRTDEEIIIYIPTNKNFNEISVESGASSIEIDTLNTRKLDFELGAGKINIKTLNVSNEASIQSGAGAMTINNSSINNLELEMGIGKVLLNTVLTGSSKIEAGIGELEINLNNSLDNYNLNINKGIGNISINGSSVSNGYQNGNGQNKINIEGGIGNIKLTSVN